MTILVTEYMVSLVTFSVICVSFKFPLFSFKSHQVHQENQDTISYFPFHNALFYWSYVVCYVYAVPHWNSSPSAEGGGGTRGEV